MLQRFLPHRRPRRRTARAMSSFSARSPARSSPATDAACPALIANWVAARVGRSLRHVRRPAQSREPCDPRRAARSASTGSGRTGTAHLALVARLKDRSCASAGYPIVLSRAVRQAHPVTPVRHGPYGRGSLQPAWSTSSGRMPRPPQPLPHRRLGPANLWRRSTPRSPWRPSPCARALISDETHFVPHDRRRRQSGILAKGGRRENELRFHHHRRRLGGLGPVAGRLTRKILPCEVLLHRGRRAATGTRSTTCPRALRR